MCFLELCVLYSWLWEFSVSFILDVVFKINGGVADGVEEGLSPWAQSGKDEKHAVEVEKGDNRLFPDEQGMRIRQCLHPCAGVSTSVALLDELIETGIGPAGEVVGGVAGPHLEKGERIRVVRDPCGHADVKILAATPVKVGFPFHPLEVELDPGFFDYLRLNCLCDCLIGFRGGENEGQSVLGHGRAARVWFWGIGDNRKARKWWYKSRSGWLTAHADPVGDGFAVDRIGEKLADLS